MTEAEKPTGLAALRVPFSPNQISLLPKPYKKESERGNCNVCGGYHGLPAMHLDYVGHAALTDRLLDVDPGWTWEPLALGDDGLPVIDKDGGLWIKLTICGVTRLGYGDAQGKTGGNAMKERIGDALRNAGMRFGAALDLWHKGELHADDEERGKKPDGDQGGKKLEADKGAGTANQTTGEVVPRLSKEQVANVTAMCDEVRVKPQTIIDAYKGKFGCTKLEEIPAVQYSAIVRQLEGKRKAA